MKELPYQRANAVEYAKTWAFKRNPAYLNFEQLGGDCTNFASQCIYAGSKIMNPTPVLGWYYYNSTNRTASWTGVGFLYQFLVNNKGVGPYAEETDVTQAEIGDVIQLGTPTGTFYHSPVIVHITPQEIFVAAHTFDAYMRPLSSYNYGMTRVLHILGVRNWK